MIHKEIIDDELYIYINGKLSFKRWLKHNYSLVFNNSEIPYSKHTLTSITDEGIKIKNQ